MTQPENQPPTPTPTPTPGPPTPTPPAVPAPTPSPWADFKWDGNVDSLPADVAAAIRTARADAGRDRTNAKATAAQEARNELAASVAQWLGVGGDEPPDVATLQQQVEAARRDQAEQTVRMRVYDLAYGLGLNGRQLLDSISFCEQIDALDTSDWAAFDAAVTPLLQARAVAMGIPQSMSPAVGRTPVEALRPGSMPGQGGQISLQDQIDEAVKKGDVRTSIALKQQLLAQQRQ